MESVAKATGLSAEEINNAFLLQENLNMSTREYEALLAKAGKTGNEDLVKRLGLQGANVAEIERQLSVQRAFEEAVKRVKEQFGAMSEDGTLDRLVEAIISFANGIKTAGIFLDGLIVKPITSVVNLLQGAVQMLGGIANLLTGGIFGDGFSQLKAGFGNFTMGAANAADIGTNLLVGGGVKGESDFFSNRAAGIQNSLNVDDFTIRTNPKDTLVMAGGTKFGEETNAILRELVDVMKRQDRVGRAYDFAVAPIANALGVITGVNERGVN